MLAATAVPLLLCLVELIAFAASVFLLLLVVFLGPVDAAIAMLLLLVGLELILAFAATLTLLLLELPLYVVPLLRLHGCEVNVRRTRQVVVWILVMLISFSACFQPCMSPIDRHRLVSDVVDGRCRLHARLSTNSCGIGHGNSHHVEHINSCMGIRANSGGANAHGNPRMERGHDVSGETKTSSMSTLSRVWGLAVGENFELQKASESLHEEAWVGRVNSSNLKISQEVEIDKEVW